MHLKNHRDKLAREAIEHAEKAAELFRQSVEVHQAEQRGEIDESIAVERAVELNKRALDESEAALSLMREQLENQGPSSKR